MIGPWRGGCGCSLKRKLGRTKAIDIRHRKIRKHAGSMVERVLNNRKPDASPIHANHTDDDPGRRLIPPNRYCSNSLIRTASSNHNNLSPCHPTLCATPMSLYLCPFVHRLISYKKFLATLLSFSPFLLPDDILFPRWLSHLITTTDHFHVGYCLKLISKVCWILPISSFLHC